MQREHGLIPVMFSNLMLIIIAVGLLIYTPSKPPSDGRSQQHPTNEYENVSQYPPFLLMVFGINSAPSPTNESQKSPEKAKHGPNKPPWWDVTWATWALVGIGSVGTGAAIYTLILLKRQTDTLVASERAWVDFALRNETNTYMLNVTNYGRTIAKIDSYSFSTSVLPFNSPIPENPQEVVKKENLNRLLIPSGTETFAIFGMASYFANDWEDITAAQKAAFFFITINYEDAAGNLRETSTCYSYSPLSFTFIHQHEKKRYN